MLKQAMWVLWPAFLVAGATTGLLFSYFDPQDLHWPSPAITLSRQAAYTLGFFLFWAMASISAAATMYMSMSPSSAPEQGK